MVFQGQYRGLGGAFTAGACAAALVVEPVLFYPPQDRGFGHYYRRNLYFLAGDSVCAQYARALSGCVKARGLITAFHDDNVHRRLRFERQVSSVK